MDRRVDIQLNDNTHEKETVYAYTNNIYIINYYGVHIDIVCSRTT